MKTNTFSVGFINNYLTIFSELRDSILPRLMKINEEAL